MKRLSCKPYLISLLLGLFGTTSLWAQDKPSDTAGEMVKLNGSSRTYYPDRLGFSPDASLLEVMQMLLNGRNTDIQEVLKHTCIKLNYLPLDMDVVAFLSQLRVSDVSCIHFYTDQTVSEAVEGLETEIIIEQRTDKRGKSGYIDSYVTSEQDLKTSARLNYNTDRWMVWGTLSFMSAHEELEVEKQEAELPSGTFGLPLTTRTDRRQFEQNVMTYAQYTGSRNVVTMYALSYFADAPDIHTEDSAPASTRTTRKQKKTHWVGQAKWRHYFGKKSDFYTMCRFSTEKEPYTITSSQDVLDHKQNNGFVYNETRMAFNELTNLSVNLGTDSRVAWDNREVDFQELPVSFTRQAAAAPSKEYYGLEQYRLRNKDTRPFIEATYNIGPVVLYAGFRTAFVHYSTTGSQHAADFNEHYRNDSWQAMAKWQINPRHTVTLDYSRRFSEPTVLQNYPALILQPDENHALVKGNSRFKLPTYRVLDANYSYQKGSFQGLLDVRYFHAMNELVSVPHTIPVANTDVLYYQWENGEDRKGVNVDMKLFWKYRQFLVMNVEGVFSHDRYTQSNRSSDYFYVRLMPLLTLPAEFKVTAQLTYHSSINTPVMHEDAFWYGSLQLSKHWGTHWKVYFQWNNLFNQRRTTTELSSDYRVLTRTNQHDNKLTLGLSYQF